MSLEYSAFLESSLVTFISEGINSIIEMIRANDFRSMLFSYDINGYPVGMEMKVYLIEDDWQKRDEEPYMRISFRQDDSMNEYNIVEDYDKF